MLIWRSPSSNLRVSRPSPSDTNPETGDAALGASGWIAVRHEIADDALTVLAGDGRASSPSADGLDVGPGPDGLGIDPHGSGGRRSLRWRQWPDLL